MEERSFKISQINAIGKPISMFVERAVFREPFNQNTVTVPTYAFLCPFCNIRRE
jgi:hypothetical protein